MGNGTYCHAGRCCCSKRSVKARDTSWEKKAGGGHLLAGESFPASFPFRKGKGGELRHTIL